jgi:hypothetical protein
MPAPILRPFSLFAATSCLLALCARAHGAEPIARTDTPAGETARKPAAVIVSKETTYITEPLRGDGYGDYASALNARASHGVDATNNAVPFVCRAMGPGAITFEIRSDYFRKLGVAIPTSDGDYFISLEKYVENQRQATRTTGVNLSEKEIQAAKNLTEWGRWRTWKQDECSILARWLEVNAKPLAMLVEASKQAHWYEPIIANGPIIQAPKPAAQGSHQIIIALLVRATNRIAQRGEQAAWDDLLAVHRLARLMGQGPLLIDALIAFDTDQQACRVEQLLLANGKLSRAEWDRRRLDLEKLPPIPRMRDKIEPGERFCLLDIVGLVARNGFEEFRGLFGPGPPATINEKRMFLLLAAIVDFNVMMRVGNSWYDRLADALREPTHTKRAEALRKVAGEIDKLKASYKHTLARNVLFHPQNAVSELIGDMFVIALLPPTTVLENPGARDAMRLKLTIIGFALAAYHADHASYPAELAELVPTYIAAIPTDVFDNGKLHYQLKGGGYRLYSFGPNGVDDGGREIEGARRGESWDDVSLSVPGPSKN